MAAVGYTGGDPTKVNVAGYAKGDVLAASAAGTLQPVHVGVDTTVLTASASAAQGVEWDPSAGGGGGVPTTRRVDTTAPLGGGGDLSANRTLTVAAATASGTGVVQLAGDLAGTAAAPTVPGLAGKVGTGRAVNTTGPLAGGGPLSSDLTLTVAAASITGTGVVQLAGDLSGTATAPTVPGLASKVPATRTVSTTAPLTGGGALTGDLVLTAGAVLTGLGAVTGVGSVTQVGPAAFVDRVLQGSSNVLVTNGDGVAGNPTVDLLVTGFVTVTGLGTSVTSPGPALQVQNEVLGRTWLSGSILLAASVVFATNSVLFTLPVGFRPKQVEYFLVRSVGSSTQTNLKFNLDGTVQNVSAVTAGASGDVVGLTNISFLHA